VAVLDWTELGAIEAQRVTRLRSRDLEDDGNGWARERHLLLITAFSPSANPKKPLNPQEIFAFAQVLAALHQLVASP
jgi:hypothetical protein